MNNVVLMGRLTQKPKIKSVQGENPLTIAQYTLAVPRYYKKANNTETDFIRCVAFGKAAEFAGKYFAQGLRIVVSGRIQTSTYLNRHNEKVYTSDVIVEKQEFADYKVSVGEEEGAQQVSNEQGPDMAVQTAQNPEIPVQDYQENDASAEEQDEQTEYTLNRDIPDDFMNPPEANVYFG